MSKAYEFLKECGTFFVATVNGDLPAVRPFGAVMEIENELYFSTGSKKNVYKQLQENRHVQIVALKQGTREWIRLNGIAVEVMDLNLKQKMLDICPILTKRFSSKDDPLFALFKLEQMQVYLNNE